jgi:bifunctional DNA-binding transcriptional regulator/antitoxin component of YhaV-PrlF toxin-antitoxin module
MRLTSSRLHSTGTKKILARLPYRCAVGVKVEASAWAEISHQVCRHKEYTCFVIAHIRRKQPAVLLRLRQVFQVTLPAEPRRQLYLAEDDSLEPEGVEEGILLKPIRVIEQKKAWVVSDERLRHGWRGVFVLCLSEKIL